MRCYSAVCAHLRKCRTRSQIDDDIAERYASANWLIIRGTLTGDATTSTYEFFRRVVGYDLAGFFQRHSGRLRAEIELLLGKLLD